MDVLEEFEVLAHECSAAPLSGVENHLDREMLPPHFGGFKGK
jgi:hypothetical protein